MKHVELMIAYHKVASQARHVMALHRRMVVLLGAAAADGDKLTKALEEAQRLEEAIGLEELRREQTILSGG